MTTTITFEDAYGSKRINVYQAGVECALNAFEAYYPNASIIALEYERD